MPGSTAQKTASRLLRLWYGCCAIWGQPQPLRASLAPLWNQRVLPDGCVPARGFSLPGGDFSTQMLRDFDSLERGPGRSQCTALVEPPASFCLSNVRCPIPHGHTAHLPTHLPALSVHWFILNVGVRIPHVFRKGRVQCQRAARGTSRRSLMLWRCCLLLPSTVPATPWTYSSRTEPPESGLCQVC